MTSRDTGKILITCSKGNSVILADEVKRLGFTVESSHDTGIVINSGFIETYKLNLELRSAYNVLFLLKEFEAFYPDDLYAEAKKVAWENIIPENEYISVVSQTDTPAISNSMFAGQKLKDAIVDRMKEKTGARPDSGPERKNIVINLYWKNNSVWIYLNTSGQKLSDRGYRKIPYLAPMQESLAGAVVLSSGYDGGAHFVNPMCGSGTLAIEAALIALNKAPGLLRSNYCLTHLNNFDNPRWQSIRKETLSKSRKMIDHKIIATDINKKAVAAAIKNAQTAGVDHLIDFKVCDFSETEIPSGSGTVILNPEYGERMGTSTILADIYKNIGDFFKQKCGGYACHIFTGNFDLIKKVGLRTSTRVPFYNGDIECRLLKYDIY